MTNEKNEKQKNSRRLRFRSGALRRISLQIRKIEIAKLEEKERSKLKHKLQNKKRKKLCAK